MGPLLVRRLLATAEATSAWRAALEAHGLLGGEPSGRLGGRGAAKARLLATELTWCAMSADELRQWVGAGYISPVNLPPYWGKKVPEGVPG